MIVISVINLNKNDIFRLFLIEKKIQEMKTLLALFLPALPFLDLSSGCLSGSTSVMERHGVLRTPYSIKVGNI